MPIEGRDLTPHDTSSSHTPQPPPATDTEDNSSNTNAIAANFINLLSSTVARNAPSSEPPMTLEEIENAESNRRSDSTVKFMVQRCAESEGVEGLVKMMSRLFNDSRVQWRSARTLRELILQSEDNKALCYTHHVESVIIKTLVTFSHLSVVQSHVMRLLGILSFGSDLFRRRAGEQGVMSCVIIALEKHAGDESVLLHTLTAVTNLTHNSMENRSRFHELHGLDLVVSAMNLYKDKGEGGG
eukprot:gene29191-36201_t